MLIATLCTAGCTPPEPTETTPAPSPTGTPTATSGLLEVARVAWDVYQARLSELGSNPAAATLDSLLEVAQRPHAEFLLSNFARAAEARVHSEGSRETRSIVAADFDRAPNQLLVSVCVDVSGERLVGDEGEDLTPSDRDLLQSLAATLVEHGEGYLVSNVESYTGPLESDPCT